MMEELVRHGLCRRPDIQKQRNAIWNVCGAGLGNCRLTVNIKSAPLLIADIHSARWQNCAPMHTLKTAHFSEITQVTPNCLQRYAKMLSQPIDRNFALAPRYLKDFGMTNGLRHRLTLLQLCV